MQMQVVVALLVSLAINLTVLLILRKRYDRELYRAVAISYSVTVLLRYGIAFYLWLNHMDSRFSLTFWGDSETYDFLGAAVAEGWARGYSTNSWEATVEGKVNSGFIYFVACIYYLFGRNVLLVQLLNGIIGSLTSIVILEIGLLLYDRQVAKTAMLLTAFFPQMIFWSTALYKDPAVMLCIAVAMLAVLRLRHRLSLSWILLYVASTGALVWLRFYIFYALAAATAAALVMSQRRGVMFGLVSRMVLVSAVIVLLLFTPVGQEVLMQSRYLDLEQLSVSRVDLARAGSGFGSATDVSSLQGVLSILPLGVAYLLFAPFPWMVSGLRQALALPDILVWYALVPALVRGIAATRHRLARTMPILVFTSALTLAYGAFLGNVGTAYRQRTQIMMFYFLFIADGLHRRTHRPGEEAPSP